MKISKKWKIGLFLVCSIVLCKGYAYTIHAEETALIHTPKPVLSIFKNKMKTISQFRVLIYKSLTKTTKSKKLGQPMELPMKQV